MDTPPWKAVTRYLVELERPEQGWEELDALTARTRAAAAALSRTGTPVRFLRTIFVPDDETCFFLLEAESAEVVGQVVHSAELVAERTIEPMRVAR